MLHKLLIIPPTHIPFSTSTIALECKSGVCNLYLGGAIRVPYTVSKPRVWDTLPESGWEGGREGGREVVGEGGGREGVREVGSGRGREIQISEVGEVQCSAV